MGLGRDIDKAFIKDAAKEALTDAGEPVLIKRVSGSAAGDPTKGISPTYTFQTFPSRAIITSLDQSDIMYPGGLYQVGDLRIQLTEELTEVSDQSGNIGDRVIWRGTQYRVVGKKNPSVLAGRVHFYSYVMRKVDP